MARGARALTAQIPSSYSVQRCCRCSPRRKSQGLVNNPKRQEQDSTVILDLIIVVGRLAIGD
jgi:hypothetical protein